MPNALEFVSHQGHRGIEIESLGALPFQIAMHHGWDGRLVNYSSFEYVGAWTNAVALLCLIATVLATAWLVVWRITVRTWNSSTVADAALVGLLLFVITSRVISPQYMVWLVGLGAVCALNFGRSGDSVMRLPVVLILAATGLSAVEFPYWFDDLLQAKRSAVLLLTVRNLLLVSAALIGAARLWRSTRARPAVETVQTGVTIERPELPATGLAVPQPAAARELDPTSRTRPEHRPCRPGRLARDRRAAPARSPAVFSISTGISYSMRSNVLRQFSTPRAGSSPAARFAADRAGARFRVCRTPPVVFALFAIRRTTLLSRKARGRRVQRRSTSRASI